MRILMVLTYLLLSSCTSDTKSKEGGLPSSSIPKEHLAPEIPPERLYIQKVMVACNAQLSEARRNILAEQIRIVAESSFPNADNRRWFYFLICIESKFNSEAKSPVGATGLTQVMPKYAPEFAKACGLGVLEPKDLLDSQVNLLVGACRFKELMVYYAGDPTLALAAYNSGMDSPTVRKAAALDVRQGHPETIGYLAAAFVLEHRMLKGIN